MQRNRLVEVMVDLDSEAVEVSGNKRRRSADADLRAHRQQPVDVRQRDTAVGDVADQRDAQILESAEDFAQGVVVYLRHRMRVVNVLP